MKSVLKWLLRLAVLAVVLVVVFLLSLNSILRVVTEHRIRAQTGLNAKIGSFQVGLLHPEMTIQNLKLYNPTNFGATPFLNIKEIHVEYDRDALVKNKLRLTLVRVNLRELDIVRNKAGQTNLYALGVTLPSKGGTSAAKPLKEFQQRTGLTFDGIDELNVSVGKARFIDLKNPHDNREQKIGIHNFVVKNVKTPANLAGLAVLVALRSDDFFTSVLGSNALLNFGP